MRRLYFVQKMKRSSFQGRSFCPEEMREGLFFCDVWGSASIHPCCPHKPQCSRSHLEGSDRKKQLFTKKEEMLDDKRRCPGHIITTTVRRCQEKTGTGVVTAPSSAGFLSSCVSQRTVSSNALLPCWFRKKFLVLFRMLYDKDGVSTHSHSFSPFHTPATLFFVENG